MIQLRTCKYCICPCVNMEVGVDVLDCTDNQKSNIPFVESLPDDLKAGSCINIRGFIRPECCRFSVNLCSSRSPSCDIALHINPRFSQKYVVRNTKKNGEWDKEEVTSISKFNLERNSNFELDIFIAEWRYLIAINGKHICAFPFRIPLSKVKYLEIDGDIDISEVGYGKCDIYPRPSQQTVPHVLSVGGDKEDDVSRQLDIPFTAVLSQGFPRGWQLEIYGRVKVLPEEFFVNLQKGYQVWPEPIIYLHINPRFRTVHGEQLFIKNAKLGDNWGQEERSSSFQFLPASSFSLVIRKYAEHFSLWVDGRLASEFRFRGNVEEIDTVYVQGDIFLDKIFMREHTDDKYFSKSLDTTD